MAECSNLCTAEKCQELEQRINQLEADLFALEALLNEHTSKSIPDAHSFDSNVNVSLDLSGNSTINLTVDIEGIGSGSDLVDFELDFVTKEEFQNHTEASIPDAHDYKPEVSVSVSSSNDENTIEVSVDGESGQDTFSASTIDDYVTKDEFQAHLDRDIPEAHSYEPEEYEPDIGIDSYVLDDGSTRLVVSLDGRDVSTVLGGSDANSNDTTPTTNTDYEPDLEIDSYSLPSGDVRLVFSLDGRDVSTVINIPDSSLTVIPDLPPKSVSLTGEYIPSTNEIFVSVTVDGENATTEISLDEFGNMDEIKELLEKVWSVLGGDSWAYNSTNKTTSLNLQPEAKIKTTGLAQYQSNTDTGKNVTVSNLLELVTALHSVNYFRSGHHRLPATTINSLLNTEDGNQELKIYDSLSFQEWIIRNIDALFGEFPLTLKYKTEANKEEEVSFTNISEAITESIGLLLSLAEESNSNLAATMKALTEARAAANAAIVAVDYTSANAEYLGYKGREKSREVNVSFTPGETTMSKVLKPSKQKIVGWELVGEETLTELIKRVLIGAEIIKAAMYIPWKPGDKLTGDIIKKNRQSQQEQDGTEWQTFLNRINTPTGRYKTNKPSAEIKDLTTDGQ